MDGSHYIFDTFYSASQALSCSQLERRHLSGGRLASATLAAFEQQKSLHLLGVISLGFTQFFNKRKATRRRSAGDFIAQAEKIIYLW